MRRLSYAILFLSLTAEGGMTFNGKWSTPWRWVSDLLEGESTKVPLIDVLIVGLLVMCLFRGTAWRGTARPMTRAILVGIGAAIAWFFLGVARGGSAHATMYQLHAYLFAMLLALVLLALVKTPGAIVSLAKTIVGAALFRSAFGLCFYLFVAKSLRSYPAYMTQHDDSVLFAMTVVIALCWAIERRTRRAILYGALIAALMVFMIQINNRRLAWASLAGSVALVYLVLPANRIRRRINRTALALAPVIALYLLVGWGRSERIFKPLHQIQTMTDDTNDASTRARRNENVSLVTTMLEHPVVGSGWGHEFREVDTSLTVPGEVFPMYHYIPHNGVLAFLAFTGLLGFVLHWLPFPVAAYLNARTYQRAREPVERAASLAALAQIVVCTNQIYGDMGQISVPTLFMASTGFAVAGRLAVSTGAWPEAQTAAPARSVEQRA